MASEGEIVDKLMEEHCNRLPIAELEQYYTSNYARDSPEKPLVYNHKKADMLKRDDLKPAR